jgi:hypothetical protein
MANENSIERCSVGKFVDTPCFLSRYVKTNLNLYTLEDLDENTRQTIMFRTNMKEIPSICSHHRAAYTTRFNKLKQSKKCDNPFQTHLKTKRPLGTKTVSLPMCVTVSVKTDKHFYPGQLLCFDCYQQLQLFVHNTSGHEIVNTMVNTEPIQDTTNMQQVGLSLIYKINSI